MLHKEFSFNLHNTKFYGQFFQPKKVKAVIVLVHGMGEHCNRYTHFVIPKLNKADFGVITFDQFGHGKTEGKRGHNPGFEKVLDSVALMIDKAREVFGDKPVFLYGHSMGGNVVINYALRRESGLKGVIATSPFLRIAFEPPAWKLKIAELLLKIAPSLTMSNELEVKAISRDEKVVKAYLSDPLNHDKVSPNYSIVFIKTGKEAIENADKLKIPMLLLHGTADRLTSCKASEEFAKRSKNTTLKTYEGGYHELHNDLVKEEELSDIITWINREIT